MKLPAKTMSTHVNPRPPVPGREIGGPRGPTSDPHKRDARTRMDPGTRVVKRELVTITGKVITVPDPERYIHFQFRRFAGCPVCNLHLHSFAQRHEEIVGAGVREVVVFHSTTEELIVHAADLPFAVTADPRRSLYAEFGVQVGVRSLLDPRAWIPIARGVLRSLWTIISTAKPVPPLNPPGGRYGLPADFLIDSDGTVVASKYGAHAYDQWSVDELLRLVPNAAFSSGRELSGARR